MYTRNFGRNKYTPPPGYDGTAFGRLVETKHHEPTELIRTQEIREPEQVLQQIQPEEISAPEADAEEASVIPKEEAENPLKQLLDTIRGKFGTEELIILLVMMLIASDGFGTEMLVLGILLAVGH